MKTIQPVATVSEHNPDRTLFHCPGIPMIRVINDRDFNGDAYTVFGQASYLFGEKLNVTAGLRYEKQEMDFTDYVTSIQNNKTWDEISPTEAYLTNAAEASAIGGEVDITARLTESLSVNVSLGYTNIKLDTYKDALGDYKGNKIPMHLNIHLI